MKRFSHIIIYIVALLLTGCHEYYFPPDEPPQPRAEAERTVIIYMAADNSLFAAVKKDTTEMAIGKNMIPEDVNFIIYLDDRLHKPAIYELSAKNGLKLWKQYNEELCSTDSEVMLDVLKEIEHYFPARHYGITLWSHATGWTPRRKTFGVDDNHGNVLKEREMEIPELHDVLAQLPKFDYIFFDACFMQCVEVAYELRDVTDWIVGSPAETPGPGAPYDKIIASLSSGDVQGIVQGYDSGYPGIYDGFNYPGILLSCIDCSKLETLAEATETLLTPFYLGHSEPLTTGFLSYCSDWTSKSYLFDMRTTMFQLLSEEDYTAWMDAFEQAVPLHTLSSTQTWYAEYCDNPRVQNPECYGGVSMFVPMEKYETYGLNRDFQQTSWYQATGWQETGW